MLLILPLQGVAAILAPLLHCAPQDTQTVAEHASHGHHDGVQQNGSQPDADHEYTAHQCCHHVFSGAVATNIRTVPPAPLTVQPVILLLATLFIPDLPLHPPRG